MFKAKNLESFIAHGHEVTGRFMCFVSWFGLVWFVEGGSR